MDETKNFKSEFVAEKIVNYCISSNIKFIFLSGNGGAGKTELSKILSKEIEKHGHANMLDMDDFVVDTKLRNSSTVTWYDSEKGEQKGRYSTAFEASYFLQNIKAILYNIQKGNNYYHWPKKAVDSNECRLLYGDALLTIVDGVGTVFLDKNKYPSFSIFMLCSKDIEIARRIKRGRFSNEKSEEEVLKNFNERNSQYKANIEPHLIEFELVLESLEDYSVCVNKDDYKILS